MIMTYHSKLLEHFEAYAPILQWPHSFAMIDVIGSVSLWETSAGMYHAAEQESFLVHKQE